MSLVRLIFSDYLFSCIFLLLNFVETSELRETNLGLVLPGGILIEILTMKGLTPYIWWKTSVVCKLWAKVTALRPTMESVFANIAITDRESSLINNPTDIARILGCGFAWNLHLNANTLYQFSSYFTHEEINRLGLRSLTLVRAMSKDMATLSAFKSLTKLCITSCDVLDLNWVSDSALKSLRSLEISENVGSFDFSLAPLKMLPNLIELCIMQNAFEGKLAQTDIASLQNLETLSIGESDLRQLDALSALSSLRELNLSNYGGTSLGGISGLTALESLDLSWYYYTSRSYLPCIRVCFLASLCRVSILGVIISKM